MPSLYLNRLSRDEYGALKTKLHQVQHGVCFICGQEIDLKLHGDNLDIDHIVPINVGGKDDPANFALTHHSCNRSKQDANLEVARVLHEFERVREDVSRENRGPNLDDVLRIRGGARYELALSRSGNEIKYCLPDAGDNQVCRADLYTDGLSGFEYFFAKLPIEYLFHDDKINPRSIGPNLAKLLKEFHSKRPQLHVSLAWVDVKDGTQTRVRIFDGQHKAAAQILLGTRQLPVRVFVNPDADVLLTTNTNAGTVLRQVAFESPFSVVLAVHSTLTVFSASSRTPRGQRTTSRSPSAICSSTSGASRGRSNGTFSTL